MQVLGDLGLCLEVVDMSLRDLQQPDAAEDARKAPEILVLEPASAAPADDEHGQHVLPRPCLCRHVKFGRRERVLAVADKFAVEPDIDAALDALKAQTQTAGQRRQRKRAGIAAGKVALLRDFRRANVLASVPGVHGVDILRLAVALQLQMSRHGHAPGAFGKAGIEEIPVDRRRRVRRLEGPFAVERQGEKHFSLPVKKFMVRMRRQTAHGKDRRVCQIFQSLFFFLCDVLHVSH